MSLSINQQKVSEQLKNIHALQGMIPMNVEQVYIAMPTAEVYGTLSIVPPDFEKAKERLFKLRRSLEDKGEKFLSSEELEKEIDDTRGR